MNPIALIFAGVMMFIMLFFGISTSQSIIDSTNVSTDDVFSDNFNTTKDVSTQTFTVMSYIPYLIFIIGLFMTLLMLAQTIK